MLPDNAGLKALIAEASPGPWESDGAQDDEASVSFPNGDARIYLQKWHGAIVCYGNEEADEDLSATIATANADLCVLAPALAAEVIRLREKLAAKEATIETLFQRNTDRALSASAHACELERERDAARQEAEGLRSQLTALTDPSPAAQLERYRAAQKLVNE